MLAFQSVYSRSNLSEWWPVLLGLLVLYVPTFYNLSHGLWAAEEQAHGPIILLLSCWLFFRRWPGIINIDERKTKQPFGWLVFLWH